ncbi:MAG: prolipoprotein diacylglyceryl transferase [Caldilineaceae bacterium]|jgi:phosphatidylglycerol:prolipoprotein diacylglycerol transferase
MYPPVDPIIFQAGPLALRWYGILLVAGMITAAWMASRYVTRRGEDGEKVWDMLVWVLIPGLIGARLYYVFVQSPRGPEGFGRFMENPITILQIWTGGIHIYGALILGGLSLILFARWNKLNLPVYLDGLGIGVPLGQAIGRWANFINQELYGPPTTLPWGLRIAPEHRIPPYHDFARFPESTHFHPLFLYESLWNFIGFGLIFWLSRRFENKLRPGDLFLCYLIWYPLGRFFIEFIRTDSWFFAGTPFNVVHLISAVVIVGSVIALILRHRNYQPERAKKSATA